MPYKIIFCGTPEFAIPSLNKLVEDPEFSVEQVFSQPDRPSGRGQRYRASPTKIRALDHGLEVKTPKKISAREIVLELVERQLDMAVVVAFGQILSEEFLASFRMGCFNLHSSLLPRWRGAAPMERAIMAGDSATGVSLQKIVKKLDAGPVIGQKTVGLSNNTGAEELYEKLSHLGAELLVTDLKAYLRGECTGVEQDEKLVTYAKKIHKEESWIDWMNPAFSIHNKIRALDRGTPFAGTYYRKKILKIHRAKILEAFSIPPSKGNIRKDSHGFSKKVPGQPGEIIDIGKESLMVSCGEGAIEVFTLQPENKAKMTAREFICGYRPEKGECFE